MFTFGEMIVDLPKHPCGVGSTDGSVNELFIWLNKGIAGVDRLLFAFLQLQTKSKVLTKHTNCLLMKLVEQLLEFIT